MITYVRGVMIPYTTNAITNWYELPQHLDDEFEEYLNHVMEENETANIIKRL